MRGALDVFRYETPDSSICYTGRIVGVLIKATLQSRKKQSSGGWPQRSFLSWKLLCLRSTKIVNKFETCDLISECSAPSYSFIVSLFTQINF